INKQKIINMRLPIIKNVAIPALLGIILLQSCGKTNVQGGGTADVASLNIVNALPTSIPLIPVLGTRGPVVFNFIPGSPQYGSYQSLGSIGSVSYGTNVELTAVAGKYPVYLAQKNSDTLSADKNTLLKYMFDSTLSFTGNTIYSLFITGKDTTLP